jgi:hypothetical protein
VQPRASLCLAALACAAGLASLPAAEPANNGVAIEVKKGHLDFRVGDELAARYHVAPEVAKPYFWPVNAAGGVPVTRAWPMEKGQPGESTDHLHQKSLWFCHGDVIPEGVELKQKVKGVRGVDFWSEFEGAGRIVCTHVGDPKGGKDHASVATRNEWRTADGMKIMDEARTITLYRLGDARLYVLDIDLHASVAPITFGDTKEGSLGVRVNDQLREKGGKGRLENAEGKKGADRLWGLHSKWNDYSGPVDGKEVGIAVFDDPENAHPAAWHSRDYGLMAANPFGRTRSGFPATKGNENLVRLAKGEHLKLRYGILVHLGDASEAKVAEQYGRFVKRKG